MSLHPAAQQMIRKVEALSGRPVHVAEDPDLKVMASITTARGNAPAHFLRYRPGTRAVDYLVAYQLGFLVRLFSCPAADRRDVVSSAAEQTFRMRGGGLRPDAMSFCLGAMERFEGMPRAEVQKITFEIAMLGSRGLDVNDPAEKYSLRSIPGKFSGLHLLCIEYVGFQIIDPKVDIGFDLAAEYAAARGLFGK